MLILWPDLSPENETEKNWEAPDFESEIWRQKIKNRQNLTKISSCGHLRL